MPGIACAVSFGEPFNRSEEIAERLLHPLEGLAATQQRIHVSQNAVLGAVHFGPDGDVTGDKLGALAFHGEVAWSSDDAEGIDSDGVARHLLRRYRRDGVGALCGLNGYYSVLLWEPGKLTIVTDRLGVARLHLWRKGGLVFAATRMRSFLWHPQVSTAIDATGLATVLMCQCPLEDLTLLREVAHAPRGSVITHTADGSETRRYWDLSYNLDREGVVDAQAYGEEFARLLARSVSARMSPRLAIAISAGLDSRALLGFAAQSRDTVELASVTLGPAEAYDVVYGRKIAETCGVPHTRVPIPDDFYARFGAEAVYRTEGAVTGHTAWRTPLDDFLAANRTDALFHGYLGELFQGARKTTDVMQAQSNVAEAFRVYYEDLFEPPIDERGLSRLVKPNRRDEMGGVTREMLWKVFESAPAQEMVNHADYTTLSQLHRRFYSTPIDYASPYCSLRVPFYDHDLMQLANRIPIATRYGARVYRAMISNHLPSLARIPYSGSALPINAPWWEMMVRKAWGRVKFRVLPAITWGRANPVHPGSYVYYAKWLREGNWGYVSGLLAEEQYLDDYFDMDNVRKMVVAFRSGDSDDYGVLYQLATFVLFRKLYCEDRGQKRPGSEGVGEVLSSGGRGD